MDESKRITDEDLIKTAIDFRERAYAPYSNFRVGAAVEGESGRIYGGCNVENASYGLTICAERNAIFRAVGDGEKTIKRIAVVTASEGVSMPCGACRQVIAEFGRDAEVLCAGVSGKFIKYSAAELLPNFDEGGSFRKKLEEVRQKPE